MDEYDEDRFYDLVYKVEKLQDKFEIVVSLLSPMQKHNYEIICKARGYTDESTV